MPPYLYIYLFQVLVNYYVKISKKKQSHEKKTKEQRIVDIEGLANVIGEKFWDKEFYILFLYFNVNYNGEHTLESRQIWLLSAWMYHINIPIFVKFLLKQTCWFAAPLQFLRYTPMCRPFDMFTLDYFQKFEELLYTVIQVNYNYSYFYIICRKL